jgi:hypothetical protein
MPSAATLKPPVDPFLAKTIFLKICLTLQTQGGQLGSPVGFFCKQVLETYAWAILVSAPSWEKQWNTHARPSPNLDYQ